MRGALLIIAFVYQTIYINFVSGTCSYRPYEKGVSTNDIQWIVYAHNYYRQLLAQGKIPNQPRATNMKRMYWDETLAREAQKIADTCTFDHVTVHDGRFKVGQNLYTMGRTEYKRDTNWYEAITFLFDEYKLYRYPSSSSAATGHYTQIAWANSQYVGCGYTHYYSDNGYHYQKLYVCNYGPAGNYPGAPYETGSHGCENLC